MNRRKFVKNTLVNTIGAYSIIQMDLERTTPDIALPGIDSGDPLVRVADMDVNETIEVQLSNGKSIRVKVVEVIETRDPIFQTLTGAIVKIEVNGQPQDIQCANYHLPVTAAGVQVDCPAISGYMVDAGTDWWKLKKSVRLRFWPGDSMWIQPGTFKYPIKQKWMASRTWFSNEPISPSNMGSVYYHAGMDIGAVEGLTEVIAATHGKVVTVGDVVGEEVHPAARPRYDVVYIEDHRGWLYRYSHLSSIDANLKVGDRITMGQRIGYVGKEGGSGGWSHLHFHIESLQPSGLWGIQDSYAFLWQSYLEEFKPEIVALARPHVKTLVGLPVDLDASGSWSKARITSYEWSFMDGSKGWGPVVSRVYDTPGTYSELVKITDAQGRIDYDFMIVMVYPVAQSETNEVVAHSIPGVHVAYYPTHDIYPGDPVIFQSRGRGLKEPGGVDVYDFGDGSPKVEVPSNIEMEHHAANGYGTGIHHFPEPGHYIVRVDRTDPQTGYTGSQHVIVTVKKRQLN